eukprot:366130-Chlamydomonas_euryale.AAC.36
MTRAFVATRGQGFHCGTVTRTPKKECAQRSSQTLGRTPKKKERTQRASRPLDTHAFFSRAGHGRAGVDGRRAACSCGRGALRAIQYRMGTASACSCMCGGLHIGLLTALGVHRRAVLVHAVPRAIRGAVCRSADERAHACTTARVS